MSINVYDSNGRLKTNEIGVTIPVTVPNGGTGLTATAQGDILYADAANSLARLAKDGSAVLFLSNQGTSNNPLWANPAVSSSVSKVASDASALPASLDDVFTVLPCIRQTGYVQFNTSGTLLGVPIVSSSTAAGSTLATTIDRYGVWRKSTAAAGAGNIAYQTTGTSLSLRTDFDLYLLIRLRTVTTGSCRLFVGMYQTTSEPARNADPGGYHVGIRYDTVAGDTGWVPTTKDNTTQDTGTQFGVAPINAHDYLISVKISGGGTTANFAVKDLTAPAAVTTGSVALRSGLKGQDLLVYAFHSYNEGTTQAYETTGWAWERGATS